MIEIIESIMGFVICVLAFGYAWFAWRSWGKGYEIEAIWRMMNAIFWAVVYYGRYVWL
jgi:hypothetical protein